MEAGIAFAWRHAYDHDAGYLSFVPFSNFFLEEDGIFSWNFYQLSFIDHPPNFSNFVSLRKESFV